MSKLLTSASIVALLAIAPAAAQTTPPATTPPATTQEKSPSTMTPPSTAQDKSSPSTTSPSTAQDKSSPSTTSPSTAQSGTEPAKQDQAAAVMLTEDQAKEWVDKPVYSSDGNEIGEVVEFVRGTDNKVSDLHVDMGGFLGMGQTRVKLAPSEFKLQGDRVVLNITEEQAKALPKLEK